MLQKRFGLDCNLHLKVLVEGSCIPFMKNQDLHDLGILHFVFILKQ